MILFNICTIFLSFLCSTLLWANCYTRNVHYVNSLIVIIIVTKNVQSLGFWLMTKRNVAPAHRYISTNKTCLCRAKKVASPRRQMPSQVVPSCNLGFATDNLHLTVLSCILPSKMEPIPVTSLYFYLTSRLDSGPHPTKLI